MAPNYTVTLTHQEFCQVLAALSRSEEHYESHRRSVVQNEGRYPTDGDFWHSRAMDWAEKGALVSVLNRDLPDRVAVTWDEPNKKEN